MKVRMEENSNVCNVLNACNIQVYSVLGMSMFFCPDSGKSTKKEVYYHESKFTGTVW